MSNNIRTEDIEAFVKSLTIYSKLVNFDLTDEVTMFYVESLKNFDLARCRAALLKFARSAKPGRGLPSIDDILGEVAPEQVIEPSIEDDAALAAERIAGCLIRYGSMANEGWKTQRDFIGELGWAVVEMAGGWMHLCTTVTNDDLPTLKSQWRKEAVAYGTRLKAHLATTPGLPPGTKDDLLLPAARNPALQMLTEGIPSLSREMPPANKLKAFQVSSLPQEEDPW